MSTQNESPRLTCRAKPGTAPQGPKCPQCKPKTYSIKKTSIGLDQTERIIEKNRVG